MNAGMNWQTDYARLVSAKSRSISAENPTGEPAGGGRHFEPDNKHMGHLGKGWKARPYVRVEPGEVFTMADIAGPGCIRSVWMTPTGVPYRNTILRVYWDGQDQPAVECPLGDFFASAFTSFDVLAPLNSLAVCVNPGNAFNCYWPMPFQKQCRMTIENRDPQHNLTLFYQVNYDLAAVPDDAAYFHAQFRRVNPLPYQRAYTIIDGIRGRGHYAGTYMAWGLNNNRWWGEGEIKFYLDDDIPEGTSTDNAIAEHGGECYPTICGTGTEDYFCGSYNFENKATKQYQEYSTAYAGVPHIVRPDGVYNSQMRFSMYRWHLPDPIRFDERLAVTIQALGWRSHGRYLPLQDDIASTAFWYQQLPTAAFPELGTADELEIN